MTWWFWLGLGFAAGLILGSWASERRWREKGDHVYMNRIESGGRLYEVRRES